MKKTPRSFAAPRVAVAALLAGSGAHSSDFSSGHDKILRHFRAVAQPKASEAVWLQHNVLLLAVPTQGLDEDDYAEAACADLLRFGFSTPGLTVRIADPDKMRNNRSDAIIAEERCDTE